MLGPTTPGRWSVMGLPDDGAEHEGLRMRIGEVIGRVTMSRLHPQLQGGRFLLALPMPLAALTDGSPAAGKSSSSSTTWVPAPGSLIGISEGREAANPFGKTKTPVDAYCACLIDQISV